MANLLANPKGDIQWIESLENSDVDKEIKEYLRNNDYSKVVDLEDKSITIKAVYQEFMSKGVHYVEVDARYADEFVESLPLQTEESSQS